MNENINDLVKKLPDYEDFMKIIEAIEATSRQKARLEIQIKVAEAETVKRATVDPSFFQSGKSPSMAYIESTYKFCGLDGELVVLRNELADLSVSLSKLYATLDIYKTMLDIWRTLSANSRRAEL